MEGGELFNRIQERKSFNERGKNSFKIIVILILIMNVDDLFLLLLLSLDLKLNTKIHF